MFDLAHLARRFGLIADHPSKPHPYPVTRRSATKPDPADVKAIRRRRNKAARAARRAHPLRGQR